MLYLDEVVIHNFKSFKHAAIKFNQGFNCIVGPNGSGKSNICDSLLFAMGETSLKRMRVSSSPLLINNTAKPVTGEKFKRAYVKVRFTGDKDIEILRTVRSDRKVGYRMDGRRVTRQEVVEALRAYKCEINETNTITQGEINYLNNLSPKGRRELIDIAAGIREFNEKRDSSLKEMEKVDAKISEARIQLSERSGFLNELEKEKVDAERFIELTNATKSYKYTLLKFREQQVSSGYEEAAKGFDKRTEQTDKLNKEISALDAKIGSLGAEKDKVSKHLGARSAELGSTNKLLEEVNKNIAVRTTQLGSLTENSKNASGHSQSLKSDLSKAKAKEKENLDSIKKMGFELEVKSKNLPEVMIDESATDAESLTEKLNDNQKKMGQYESGLLTLTTDLATLSSDYDGIRKSVTEAQKTMNELGSKKSETIAKVKASQDALSNARTLRDELSKELEKETELLAEVGGKIDTNYTENVRMREALVMSGKSSDKIDETLKKSVKSGFHGRAQDLCNYDEKYAVAVTSAAGSRLNYLVVDSIDVANDAIKVLKAQKLGRASFIPLEDIVVKPGKEKGLTPLLDYIKYEKKYAKAFEYIFSNTFLVNDIKEAQKIGLGAYRFVTLEGDLVEPSGIVTGGAVKVALSSTLIESRLKKLESDKKELIEEQKKTSVAIETLKKRIASHDIEIMRNEGEIKHLLETEDQVNKQLDSLTQKVKDLEVRNADTHVKLERVKNEKKEAEDHLEKLKAENDKIQPALQKLIIGRGKSAKSKEEAAKLKALRDEVEKLKISIASLNTENEMLKTRVSEINAELKKDTDSISSFDEKTKQAEKELADLEKQKAELQEMMHTQDKKTSGMLKEIAEFDTQITKLGLEKGKLSSELERASRELIELEGKKSQLQTRLNDIKAELMAYPKMEMLKDVTADELEKRQIIATNELERLGAVNLKAPEMYEVRSKDVKEAQQKMETLETEKGAILSMIEEIEHKKIGVFMDTFNTVNENFKKLYNYVFDGDSYLYLQDPKDPFNSGLAVSVEINRKKHNMDLLSGGQKSLTLLMLIFAIQMRQPMSFYIFDEIDMALDKENSKKLSKLIKELSDKSQFVVVSHNDTLIAAADTAVGVVNKANESQVVGIQLTSK